MSNSYGVPSETEIKLQAQKALADSRNGTILVASAEQRMAYVAGALHEHLTGKGNTFAPLAECLKSPEAARALRDAVAEQYLSAPLDTSVAKNDATSDATTLRSAQVSMIFRAVQLAAILAANNVSYFNFDDEAGVFQVPPSLFVAKGEGLIGAVAKADLVHVNDRGILITRMDEKRGEVFANIRTSVARLRAVHMPKKERTPRQAGRNTGTVQSEGKAVPVGLDDIIIEAARILSEPADKSDGPVLKSDFSETAWNALATLATFYHVIDAESQDKPKAAPAKGKGKSTTPVSKAA